MAWRLAHSLETLRSQVNERFPTRDTRSDGAIGDTAHAATASDHNPNSQGVVCAIDIDVDLDGVDDSYDATGQLIRICEAIVESRDSRVAFLILHSAGGMCRSYDKPGIPAWTWAPYTGADPHTSHLHISVGQGPEGNRIGNYDDPSPWALTALEPSTPAAPAASTSEEDDEVADLLINVGGTIHLINTVSGLDVSISGTEAAGLQSGDNGPHLKATDWSKDTYPALASQLEQIRKG